jgi:hypothetical protein
MCFIKIIYLFKSKNRCILRGYIMNGKILELIGFGLIGGTIYAFVGLIPQKDPAGWPIFWACAAGALGIIMLRKKIKKNQTSSN